MIFNTKVLRERSPSSNAGLISDGVTEVSLSVYPCRFCQISKNEMHRKSPPSYNIKLWNDDNAFVVPTKGALIPDWLLAVPRHHYLSSLNMPADERFALFNHVATAITFLQRTSQIVTVFENCPVNCGSSAGCGIDHAHIHVIGTSFSLISRIGNLTSIQFHPFQTYSALVSMFMYEKRALSWFHDSNGSCGFLYLPIGERQYVRRLIARVTGHDDHWDYDAYPFPNTL